MSGAPGPAAESVGQGPARRRALLEKALRDRLQRASPAAAAPADVIDWPRIVPDPVHRHEPFPLTEIQQAYWLGRNAGFELGGVGIHGYFEVLCRRLDVPRLARAWQRVIERHDMMRAVIQRDGRQRILETVPPYEIAVLDLRGANETEIEAALRPLRDRMSHQVFSPDAWPLFEIVAARLSDEWTRLLFSEDAIHVDLVSSAMIFDDWLRLYHRPETELPPLELSYRDYVLGLGQLPQTSVYRAASQYWRERVETLPPPPDLPRVPLAGPPRFERMQYVLAAESWQRIRRRAAAENLSTSSLLLAVYAEVLGQWSSSLRFTLNVTVYNRLPLHPQVAHLAGDFTSMALLEVDRTAPSGLLERAHGLQRQLWADLEHHCLNGVEVLRQLAARHGGSGAALMPYVFTGSLGNAGYRNLQQLGTIEYAVTQTPQVLIDQQVFEEAGELVLTWDMVPAAFPPGMAAEMFAHSSKLIDTLADQPASWNAPVAAPPVVRPATVSRPEPAGLLHEYFDRHAHDAPDRQAILSGREVLSYGELAARANQMARRLRACGVEPDRPVAILAARGWRPIAAAIAAGKAGCPYLPLDPASPRERQRQILENASTRIVVADDPGAFAGCGLQVITFEQVASESTAPLPSVQQPSDLAYVMYTSGSTGAPKGALIEQRSVTNRMRDVVERFALGADDRAFAVTALHHDLSVFDIFGMLACAGGTLVVPDAETMKDPSLWYALLAQGRVTVWNSVPAFVEMLVRCHGPALPDYQGLKTVMLSGDRIPPDLPSQIRRLMPRANVYSLGGPTETTVWDIWHPIEDDDLARERIPYGVPLTNAAYFVMKDNLEECPVWTPGELCITGTGLARGYLGSPDLTSERFVHHPRTGDRLYRSGDLGRRLPNGEIDILGRRDRQVKLRGHRIELGEVEAAIASAPGVRAAAVELVARDRGQELVALLVVEPPTPDGGVTSLGAPAVPDSLESACAGRRSHRHFLADPVPRPAFATLLGCLANHAPAASMGPRHLYPSAGTQYAVRTYVHAKAGRVEGMAEGWHLYSPDRHALTLVSNAPHEAAAHHERNHGIFLECAFSILLVGDLAAIDAKYEEWARDFALIEAGAMSQLLMMAAGTLGVGLCPIGGMDLAAIEEPLSLGDGRQLLHSLCGGSVRGTPARLERISIDPATHAEQEIRKSLRARLPPHMVPQRFVFLERLPLSSNGKIDRAALTQLVETERRAAAAPLEPAGELVALVRHCWETVLGRTGIGAHDRIFEAGADSFQTVQAWSEIKKRANVEFDLVEMFRNPTVAMLAAHLSGAASHAEIPAGQDRAAIRRRAREQRAHS